MKVGDLVKYGNYKYHTGDPVYGLVVSVDREKGVLKVVDRLGEFDWFIEDFCELVCEGR